VGSTQTELADLARAGAPEGTVVVARHQTVGRGRLGHAWWDAAGESLLLSVLLRPPIAPGDAPCLSQVAALAVTDALEAGYGVAAGIRWPNDVLVGDRKIGGILPEAAAAAGGRVEHVLLGIGVNVNETEFPEEIGEAATSLRRATGRAADVGRLTEFVLDALDRRYAMFLARGFGSLRVECRHRSVTIGRAVRLADGRTGIAADIDADGALVVRTVDGEGARVWSGGVAHAPRP
jgi:BirA family biotin operon repressor/biotin-[acetyl-CoA-carboxylase] ligase